MTLVKSPAGARVTRQYGLNQARQRAEIHQRDDGRQGDC
jgi:hypothetical protein